MPATKRERYEELERWIQKTTDEWETKGSENVSKAEVEILESRMSEFKTLRRELTKEFGSPPPWGQGPGTFAGRADYATAVLNQSSSPSSGSGRSGPWAKAMMDHLDRIGAKALVPSGTITVPSITGPIVTSADRPRSILDLIRTQTLEGTDRFAFLRESVRTHAASTVEPGQLKPTSVYSVAKVEDRVRVVASLSEPVDRFMLEDVSLLRDYLEGSLREGVLLELEDQVLNGNTSTTGVLDDMTGILNQTNVGAQVFATDALTSLRKAVTQMQGLNIDMGGVAWVVSAATWEDLELTTAAEPFVLGDPGTAGRNPPVDMARMSLWGYPVVISSAMAADTALLGDFRGSVVLYQRDGINVDWSDAPVSAGTTGFEKNQLVFRCEGRWGLAVTRPAAFIETALAAA